MLSGLNIVYRREFAVKISQPGSANAEAHRAAVQRIQLHGSGTPDLSYFSKTRAKPCTHYLRLYHGLVEFLRTWCHLEASVGSTVTVKERSSERSKSFLRDCF